MTRGSRSMVGAIALLLLSGGLGLLLAPGRTSARPSGPDEEILAVVPARTVARLLERARERSRGPGLSARYRLLEELTLPHRWIAREPGPLVVTPRIASLLVRRGMGGFLARALGSGGASVRLGGDTTPPAVDWVAPPAGASLTAELVTTLQWSASDPSGVLFVDLLASFDGGATFQLVAVGLAGSTTRFDWFPPNRPGNTILRVAALDGALNVGSADRTVTLTTVLDSLLATTLRDFDQPGTQPLEHGPDLRDPVECAFCHAGYAEDQEPFFPWSGSMMANASLDPLFEACLTIAEQDAAGSGDLCIRCHVPRAWLAGRSTPTDGSRILDEDRTGVSCDHCHRMVDPIYTPGESPADDADILAALSDPPVELGTGAYVIDSYGTRRGPFEDAVCEHTFLASPFHEEAALCGTCHDVSNPAFEATTTGYAARLDRRAAAFGHGDLMPMERTYSEWLNSDYNSPEGVYAPQFGGNDAFVSTCQDCHLRAVTGQGCNPAMFDAPLRDDLPFHDLTGGNTWVPTLIEALYPGRVDPLALAATVDRARSMLRKAASLGAEVENGALAVTVVNETGHKLPTGYPEGRRMWLNVKFFDSSNDCVSESGHYDFETGVLTEDLELELYQVQAGLDGRMAQLTGLPAGPSFHFVLNNRIYSDNRIPPRGFTNAAYAAFGGAPVGTAYADGQHWDVTHYAIPPEATRVQVTLYYQTTSKEYVEFLRDENRTDGKGQLVYDLWQDNGMCPPEVMARISRELHPITGAPTSLSAGRGSPR